jgi:uncharacterized membrane protein
MATLSVLKFDAPDGAEQALGVLERLQRQQLIAVADAAIVAWPHGRKGPKTKQAVSTLAAGALSGSFWGFLFGLIFFMPVLGMALGAASGALAGGLTDYGIDDNFIKEMQSKITPGSSALFLMAETPAVDKVIVELKPLRPELLSTNLPREQESKLREFFATA